MTDHRSLAAVAAPAPTRDPAAARCARCCPGCSSPRCSPWWRCTSWAPKQGATSLINGTAVHEWTHDGRHLLGFPCH